MNQADFIPNQWLEVGYLRIEQSPTQGTRPGGSGTARMWLSELAAWLRERPGLLIVSIRELS